jgi:hypothetical protein
MSTKKNIYATRNDEETDGPSIIAAERHRPLDYAGWKGRNELAKSLPPICAASGADAALAALQEFAGGPHGQR